MDEEKKTTEELMDGMKKSSAKKALIVCLCVIAIAVLAFATHPMWCSHDFERTGRDEPTCTKHGTIYYKCRHCGKESTEQIEPLGHRMRYDDVEIETTGTGVYERVIEACELCGRKKAGKQEYLGTVEEYYVVGTVSLWLTKKGANGAFLNKEYTTVRHHEIEDYYIVGGLFNNPITGENGSVFAHVELNGDEEPHIFFASINGETVIDEERIYG